MSTQIFVNLPVCDLPASKAFFNALGYATNPSFTNDEAACLVISDSIYVMLLVEPFFKGFTPRPIADATKTTEVLLCLSADSRDEVDQMVAKALAAGGKTPNPAQDHGFMYQHGFQDLDGHLWELVYMDPNFTPHAQAETATAT